MNSYETLKAHYTTSWTLGSGSRNPRHKNYVKHSRRFEIGCDPRFQKSAATHTVQTISWRLISDKMAREEGHSALSGEHPWQSIGEILDSHIEKPARNLVQARARVRARTRALVPIRAPSHILVRYSDHFFRRHPYRSDPTTAESVWNVRRTVRVPNSDCAWTRT